MNVSLGTAPCKASCGVKQPTGSCKGPLMSPFQDVKKQENNEVRKGAEALTGSSYSGASAPFYHLSPPTGSFTESLRNDVDRPHSFIVDFIDQCVANGVPESFIVDHVLFMTNAMRDQINLTETLGVQRRSAGQGVFRQRQKLDEADKAARAVSIPRVEKGVQRNGSSSLSLVEQSTARPTPIKDKSPASHRNKSCTGKSVIRRKRIENTRPTKTIFTQTPQPMCVKDSFRGSKEGGRMVFHGFMRPTDASNRKETLKYVDSFESSAQRLPSRQQSQPRGETQQRKVTRSVSAKSKPSAVDVATEMSPREEYLTWSDGDSPATNSQQTDRVSPMTKIQENRAVSSTGVKSLPVNSDLKPQDKKQHKKEESSAHTAELILKEGGGVATAALVKRGRNLFRIVSSPPISIEVPLFFPSQQLQMYIERCERKMREAMRFLDSTNNGSFNVMR
ncbi:hypothetical protein, conserved [Trypanosoma brucei gambiense DAL972]|uniref:Uncharacterized protein n=1 Tax=Trypanosoma brucei gambiense (strain MHOM/CI/86/DAL972) TaxID=679716 RepID=D0A764_TRYB9|nr:hypothetical protein, conserved [Trypanosoma brucei gambiense DAL972]CBH17515.1 hypothetical protein, conserved [Trypanosoma brucei gambiense DAL972]|eukprot:XP_011779779.1 hypothetical protein, conserved [Trypanosoma brucei gambiense DAL972]